MTGFLPAPIEPSRAQSGWGIWNRSTQLATSAAVLGAGLFGRIYGDESPAVQGISSLAIGIGLQGVVHSIASPVTEIVNKVSQSVFGIGSLFAVTQVWENSTNAVVQAVSVTAISAMLGAQFFVIARRLVDNRYVIRIRTQELLEKVRRDSRTFSVFLSTRARRIAKGSGCLGGTLVAVFVDDAVMRGVASFFAAYYCFNIVGDVAESFFDRRVKFLQAREDLGATELEKLTFRIDCTVTVALVGVSAAFIPFGSNAHTAARVAQLPFTGGVVGLVEGFVGSLYKRKFTENSVDCIPELRKPTLENHPHYQRWRVAWSTMMIGGVAGFSAWQIGWDLQNAWQRAAIGIAGSAFVTTLPFCYWADTWNETDQLERPVNIGRVLKDRTICYLVDPRIAGVPPAYPFFVLTNALAVNDVALASQSILHKALTMTSWLSYGHAMGLEVYTGLTSRQLSWMNRFFLINAILTWRRQLGGSLS